MDISCQQCVTAFPELGVLTSQLTCGICYEIMKTPMMTSCSHTYCSLCIRTSISFKQTCPACPSDVRDDSLKSNLALDNCIAPFLSLQRKLHQLCGTGVVKSLKNHVQSEISPKLDVSPEKKPQAGMKAHIDAQQLRETNLSAETKRESNHTLLEETKVQAKAKKPVGIQYTESKTTTESKFQAEAKHLNEWIQSPKKVQTPQHNHSTISKHGAATPSSSTSRLHGTFLTSPVFSSPSRLQNDPPILSSQSDNVIRVPCPVCSVAIPERNINLHLDKCLLSQDDSKSPSQSCSKPDVPRREPLKKMVYHMMSEKEIKKKLKEYGLETKGDRSKLINRLQRYTVLFNSECDSRQPRPVSEIKRQLEREEEALSKQVQPVVKPIRVAKTADPNEIEEINRQYINENKSSFDDLIRQVREKQTKKQKKELPRDEAATPKRTNSYNSKLFEQMKTMEDDSSTGPVWSSFHPKRSRNTDNDSDDCSYSLPSPKIAKRNRIEDDLEDFVPPKKANTPRSNRIDDDEDFVASRASGEIGTTSLPKGKAVKPQETSPSNDASETRGSFDTSALGEDDDISRRSESPVLNRRNTTPEESKSVGRRTRRQRVQQRVQQVMPEAKKCPEQAAPSTRRKVRQKAEPAVAARPSRRKTKSKESPAPVRTVSRTPSLSPSRFEGFNESGSTNERERSETPELIFESSSISKSVPSARSDAESETDPGNASLSQLLSLMNKSGDSTNCDDSDTE